MSITKDLLGAREPERRRPTFVNLEAQWLWDYAQELIDIEPAPELYKLQTIAIHLESLDETARNLQSNDIFTAGIIEGKRRMLARSNLPIQSVELTPDLARAVAKSKVQPRRVPPGHKATTKKPNPLSVAGIVLDLSILDKE
jgi:hypothetical protein